MKLKRKKKRKLITKRKEEFRSLFIHKLVNIITICYYLTYIMFLCLKIIDEDSKSVEISAVIEMPLPWKTDLGSPQQRPREFFHDI